MSWMGKRVMAWIHHVVDSYGSPFVPYRRAVPYRGVGVIGMECA